MPRTPLPWPRHADKQRMEAIALSRQIYRRMTELAKWANDTAEWPDLAYLFQQTANEALQIQTAMLLAKLPEESGDDPPASNGDDLALDNVLQVRPKVVRR